MMQPYDHLPPPTSAGDAELGRIVAAEYNALRCTRCGHRQPLTAADAAGYVRRGYPRHCEITMRLIRVEEEPREEGNQL